MQRGLRVAFFVFAVSAAMEGQAPLTIDYPANDSVFPPEITAPTFVWRDDSAATAWRVDVEFPGAPALHLKAAGERFRFGEIDRRAVSGTNQPPQPTPAQAAARMWKPDAPIWNEIKRRSVERPAAITITGLAGSPERVVSSAAVSIRTSKDPAGAPIFYRDVPLMPSEVEKGVIKPLATAGIPLIGWRLRYLGESKSRLLLEGLHTCTNCHSFSRDGKTLGMDVDGPENDKGTYAIVPVHPRTSIRSENVITWNSFADKPAGQRTIGFMSQVSPDGRYAASTVNEDVYVANFTDYRFLQVFYPTRGIIAWYNRATGEMKRLPGADDPRYVQTDAVWSPDGKYLVFARAEARDAYPPGRKLAEFAGDPNEVPIRYDLYRVPFNEGRGGRAEPIAGASANGMSNTFPKVSPDGRWIVWTKCRNGQLMRPDSRLWIVPAAGGPARELRANTPLMNSWHSFSPNGRWLVFSSKSGSPYTRMYLTHIDENGSDAPAILVEDATAANRAVNIPEFVDIPPGGLNSIEAPAAEFYSLFDSALEFESKGRHAEAVVEWNKAMVIDSENPKAHTNLGIALWGAGARDQAIAHFRKAVELRPTYPEARNNLGVALVELGRFAEAIPHFRVVLKLKPTSGEARNNLAVTLLRAGRPAEALPQLRKVIEANPGNVAALSQAAWVLATSPEAAVRNGAEAVELAGRAARTANGGDAGVLDVLAAAYAEAGRFPEAVETAGHAAALATRQNDAELARAAAARQALYQRAMPFRER